MRKLTLLLLVFFISGIVLAQQSATDSIIIAQQDSIIQINLQLSRRVEKLESKVVYLDVLYSLKNLYSTVQLGHHQFLSLPLDRKMKLVLKDYVKANRDYLEAIKAKMEQNNIILQQAGLLYKVTLDLEINSIEKTLNSIEDLLYQ